MTENSLLNAVPKVVPPLDENFCPAILASRQYMAAVEDHPEAMQFCVALEREDGKILRHDIMILPPGSGYDNDTLRFVERHIKFLLWSVGGWKLYLSGPAGICDQVAALYLPGGKRAFDADLMKKVYGMQFCVEAVTRDNIPETAGAASAVGGHLDGCRVGFDLGASDYKLAAVVDGEPVFSTEIPWNPTIQDDPQYHYSRIVQGIKDAASHMQRLDSIGGSAAGIYVNNEVKVASLFRGVPHETFERVVRPMFATMQREFDVPLVVVNDGDVTALAGAMSLGKSAMLGIAMGSSQAAGYLNPAGKITGFLNEFAFTPVDYCSTAAIDEWSGDSGVGALYFSQQAVNKLAPAAGFAFPDDMGLPERLKAVQEKADSGDPAAHDIFVSIGVYLAYSIPLYSKYYKFDDLLILGRVTSGRGGELLFEKASNVLKTEFPEVAEKVEMHVPDEKSRRVGQAVAAASLPELARMKA